RRGPGARHDPADHARQLLAQRARARRLSRGRQRPHRCKGRRAAAPAPAPARHHRVGGAAARGHGRRRRRRVAERRWRCGGGAGRPPRRTPRHCARGSGPGPGPGCRRADPTRPPRNPLCRGVSAQRQPGQLCLLLAGSDAVLPAVVSAHGRPGAQVVCGQAAGRAGHSVRGHVHRHPAVRRADAGGLRARHRHAQRLLAVRARAETVRHQRRRVVPRLLRHLPRRAQRAGRGAALCRPRLLFGLVELCGPGCVLARVEPAHPLLLQAPHHGAAGVAAAVAARQRRRAADLCRVRRHARAAVWHPHPLPQGLLVCRHDGSDPADPAHPVAGALARPRVRPGQRRVLDLLLHRRPAAGRRPVLLHVGQEQPV
ncbi:hypothetical protein IWW55_002212, partial [Coemansia sp. RSA 2706]